MRIPTCTGCGSSAINSSGCGYCGRYPTTITHVWDSSWTNFRDELLEPVSMVASPRVASGMCLSVSPYIQVSAILPPRRRLIQLQVGSARTQMVFPFPAMVFRQRLFDSERDFQIYRFDPDPPRISKISLGNIYDDAHVCWGNNSPKNLVDAIEMYLKAPFTPDLSSSPEVHEWRPIWNPQGKIATEYSSGRKIEQRNGRPTCSWCGLCTCHACPCDHALLAANRKAELVRFGGSMILALRSARPANLKGEIYGVRSINIRPGMSAFLSVHPKVVAAVPSHLLLPSGVRLHPSIAYGAALQQEDKSWILRCGKDFFMVYVPNEKDPQKFQLRVLRRKRIRKQLRHLKEPALP